MYDYIYVLCVCRFDYTYTDVYMQAMQVTVANHELCDYCQCIIENNCVTSENTFKVAELFPCPYPPKVQARLPRSRVSVQGCHSYLYII